MGHYIIDHKDLISYLYKSSCNNLYANGHYYEVEYASNALWYYVNKMMYIAPEDKNRYPWKYKDSIRVNEIKDTLEELFESKTNYGKSIGLNGHDSLFKHLKKSTKKKLNSMIEELVPNYVRQKMNLRQRIFSAQVICKECGLEYDVLMEFFVGFCFVLSLSGDFELEEYGLAIIKLLPDLEEVLKINEIDKDELIKICEEWDKRSITLHIYKAVVNAALEPIPATNQTIFNILSHGNVVDKYSDWSKAYTLNHTIALAYNANKNRTLEANPLWNMTYGELAKQERLIIINMIKQRLNSSASRKAVWYSNKKLEEYFEHLKYSNKDKERVLENLRKFQSIVRALNLYEYYSPEVETAVLRSKSRESYKRESTPFDYRVKALCMEETYRPALTGKMKDAYGGLWFLLPMKKDELKAFIEKTYKTPEERYKYLKSITEKTHPKFRNKSYTSTYKQLLSREVDYARSLITREYMDYIENRRTHWTFR